MLQQLTTNLNATLVPKIFLFFPKISLALVDYLCIMTASQGKPIRKSIMYSFEVINSILNQMANEGMVEPTAEPIDAADCSPFDYAEVTGLWDEMYPEPLDANDFVW